MGREFGIYALFVFHIMGFTERDGAGKMWVESLTSSASSWQGLCSIIWMVNLDGQFQKKQNIIQPQEKKIIMKPAFLRVMGLVNQHESTMKRCLWGPHLGISICKATCSSWVPMLAISTVLYLGAVERTAQVMVDLGVLGFFIGC